MKHIMLDLETMGTSNNAAIIAIGAVEFNTDTVTDNEFYRVINLESSVRSGGVIDPDTVMWWMKQSDEARSALYKSESVHIEYALNGFSRWVEEIGDEKVCVWGNGANFDNVILRNAYENKGIYVPWKFYGDRCYRTIKNLYPDVQINRSGIHHNALDDAKTQAQHLIDICTKYSLAL